MDLATVVLFLILYYLRPQEWFSIFSTIHFVQIAMLSGLVTLFFRERSFHPRDLFRTPHDWAVFAFWLWIVVSAAHPWETFKENANLYIFYIVIVQVLGSIPRMKIFAGWWTLLIVAVALLALASLWGFDPLDSLARTNGPMRGRLILNLSIFNNPNALGHSVVPAIPMLYYYLIWKRPIALRVLGVGLLLIPLSCIYLTVSKGAFLCGAATIFATMTFGRPKSVQVMMIAAAFVFGTGALYSLPRMNELNKSRSDEAIQGRVAAFKHGYTVLKTTSHGLGKGGWGKSFFEANHYQKAPHSTYVMIGAELGYPGLFLLCAIFYCNLRTVITARTETPDEERIRRMLFVLNISYIISSWMIDFEYRPTFFMFTAAIAALHRHLHGLLAADARPAPEPSLEPAWPVWHPKPLPQPAFAVTIPEPQAARHLRVAEFEPVQAITGTASMISRIGRSWNRIGFSDLGIITLMTIGTVRFWAYIMARM